MRTGRPPSYPPPEVLEVAERYADGRAAPCRRAEGDCIVDAKAPAANGYVYVTVAGRQVQAHRVAWEQAHGPIPPGLEPDHLCNNKPCRNVAHLELVTHAENCRRAYDTPTCGRGHPWTPETTATRTDGRRACRVCANENAKRRYHERKGTT